MQARIVALLKASQPSETFLNKQHVPFIGQRDLNEMLLHNTGRAYVRGFAVGGFYGLLKAAEIRESSRRLLWGRKIDHAVNYGLLGASQGASAAIIYTGVRYGMHQLVPRELLPSKVLRSAGAGFITGALLALGRERTRQTLTLGVTGAVMFSAEHLLMTNRQKIRDAFRLNFPIPIEWDSKPKIEPLDDLDDD